MFRQTARSFVSSKHGLMNFKPEANTLNSTNFLY